MSLMQFGGLLVVYLLSLVFILTCWWSICCRWFLF